MKKLSCVVIVCLLSFGVPCRADLLKYVDYVDSFMMETPIKATLVLSGISGVVGGVIGGVAGGLSLLAKKVFSHSGPKCPLLPFVRR